jgi:hypothetical protein
MLSGTLLLKGALTLIYQQWVSLSIPQSLPLFLKEMNHGARPQALVLPSLLVFGKHKKGAANFVRERSLVRSQHRLLRAMIVCRKNATERKRLRLILGLLPVSSTPTVHQRDAPGYRRLCTAAVRSSNPLNSTLETALLQAKTQALRPVASHLAQPSKRLLLTSSSGRCLSLGKHLGSASGATVFHQIHYRSCDLLTAPYRRFYRVGVISFFGADQSQID